MGADQLDNADRCAELGVGVVLDAPTADAQSIAAAASTVLNDDTYSRSARASPMKPRPSRRWDKSPT